MPHFNFAQKGSPDTATEVIFRENLIVKSLQQGKASIGSQHTEHLSLTRTSSEDKCEKLHANFVTFPTDDAFCEST